MIELHILSIITSNDSNLITLDLNSLINLNYLKLIKLSNSSTIEVEEEFKIIKHNSPNLTSNGYNLPYLKINKDLIINSNSILNYLLNDSKLEILNLSELNLSESIALHSYLNSNLLPLILNSLYSLPANWNSLRPQISSSLTYPSKIYIPEQIRTLAKETVESSLHPNWWNLGGEVEKEAEEERKQVRSLLEMGSDAWKDRQDEERRTGKGRVKKAFEKQKVINTASIDLVWSDIEQEARKIFSALEKKLADSTTPYFFSSPNPTSLDVHLSSLLSIILNISLPQPILADQINDSFPRLHNHTTLLTEKLASIPTPTIISSEENSSIPTTLIKLLPSLSDLSNFLPSFFRLSNDHTPIPSISQKKKKNTKTATELKEEKAFNKNRLLFLGVVLVGSLTWGITTGALGLLLGSNSEKKVEEEEGEWEVVEEYVR